MTAKDKQTVRELACRYMEFAASERQQKMFARMRDNNDLIPGRPPVILDEIPWYQINIDDELTCVCEDPRARGLEDYFRRALYYVKHFPKADNLFEPFVRQWRAVHVTDIGVALPNYETRRTDDRNNIISRKLVDALEDEATLDLFRLPEISLDPAADDANSEFLADLLGDSIPVRKCDFGPYYFSAWDRIAYMRGIEAIMIDLYDRPEYLHAIVDKFVAYAKVYMDFLEKNLTPDHDVANIHCTPALISGLGDGLKGTWFRDNAQPLANISPAMFEEFAVDPVVDLAERFGYTYYGCCEPLDDKLDSVKKIKNLRKVGCTPWADLERTAEQLGGNYVLARKPNPAHVAISTDPDLIRRETEETVKTCLKYGCPYEIVLKDISTVSSDPRNLIVWADTVGSVLDKYYS